MTEETIEPSTNYEIQEEKDNKKNCFWIKLSFYVGSLLLGVMVLYVLHEATSLISEELNEGAGDEHLANRRALFLGGLGWGAASSSHWGFSPDLDFKEFSSTFKCPLCHADSIASSVISEVPSSSPDNDRYCNGHASDVKTVKGKVVCTCVRGWRGSSCQTINRYQGLCRKCRCRRRTCALDKNSCIGCHPYIESDIKKLQDLNKLDYEECNP